jgi:hypothetical protein
MLSLKNTDIVNISSEKWGTEIVINRKDTSAVIHLSEVLNFLPAGFVYKEETGMGATTLEIFAERNSIIVEPIKITASSKAFKHNCLYVGSSTKYHDKRSPTGAEINAYANDSSIKYKKIIVVADSLSKVLDAIGNSVYSDFFLVLDEIDSFQLDSNYRKSMAECIDFYKLFNSSKRAMLSATKIDFTDPILKKEPIFYIKYDTPSIRKINVITTNPNDLDGLVIDTIVNCIKNNLNQKLFIAYNSVNGCYNLAEHLVSNQNIPKDDIKILCSSASKNKVKDFYKELDSDLLPAQINFFTSAYFTGYDIHESYHLISISGIRNKIQSLSDRRFKQIAGRCRNGLLSETILHDIDIKGSIKIYTSEQLFEAANEQLASFNCMKRHYNNNSILKLFIGEINENFIKILNEKEIGLVRENVLKQYEISYLNIDSKLEDIRVKKELYLNVNALFNKLVKDKNSVTHTLKLSSTKVIDKKISKIDRDNQIIEIIEKLKKFKNYIKIDNLIQNEDLTSLQLLICKDYKKVIQYLEHESTLEIIKSSILGKRDNRMYKKIILSAIIQTLPKTHLVPSRLSHYFPINKKYLTEDILQRLDLFLAETNIFSHVKSYSIGIKLFKTLCKAYRKRDKDGKDYYVIRGYNPFNFKIVNLKKSMDDVDDLFSTIKSYL